jgi:hypothetical protein
MLVVRPAIADAPRRDVRWVGGPASDILLWVLWIPFAVAGVALGGDTDALQRLVVVTLTVSLAHQPLTYWLVYGDSEQFASRRALFTVTPLAMLGLVVAGLLLAPALVVIVAAAWNVGHTLRQRHGVARIYGRLVAEDGQTEHTLLWSWLGLAVALVVADRDLDEQIARAGIGGHNRDALDGLAAIGAVAPLLIVVMSVVTVVGTLRWVRRERALAAVNPAKWAYLASTAALFVVLVVHPTAGFLGYVGGHALEYALIVRRRIRLTDPGSPRRGALFGVLRGTGRPGFWTVYAVSVVCLLLVLDRIESRFVASTVVLTLGGLHLLHDGFIWRLRRPETRERLGMPA